MTTGNAAMRRGHTLGPVEADVWRWDGSPEQATHIINWVLDQGGTARHRSAGTLLADPSIVVNNPDCNSVRVGPGEWLLRSADGWYHRALLQSTLTGPLGPLQTGLPNFGSDGEVTEHG